MMEERRLERQRRLLAMRSAAPSLPSTHSKEFNLRLVELYKAEPCLWNTSLPEHKDPEQKRYAWEKIAAQLGSHMSAEFVRCRMRSMRYHLNVYNLQMIEYQMAPPSATDKPPEKPFYHESFAFLETATSNSDNSDQKDSASGEPTEEPKPSTADKLAKLWSDFNLKTLTKRESLAASGSGGHPPRERRSGPSIAGMVKMRLQEAQMKPLEFAMPRLGIPRVQRSIPKSRVLEQSFGSEEALSQSPTALQARPGDSVSKTKLDRDREKPTTSQKAQGSQSEDEELYSLHWNVRKEQRSLRPGHEQLRQKHPLKLRSSQGNEPTPDIF
ncbi:uncharacterized protein [Drosophila takahashii]|uniref:uncharacterized protein n=1 Tax=Drosophila takahashii TaxID=29030 RepID=UPI001CF89D32|nr:uncharacterized protein LOC108069719 [Drosophila takahashii]